MKLRPCIDCGTPTTGTYCDTHRKAHENTRTRPSAHARGYDTEHRDARAELKRTLPAPCGYCGNIVDDSSPWHAAHVIDGDPTAGYIVAHPSCNERAKIGR